MTNAQAKQQALQTLRRIAANPELADQYTEQEIELLEQLAYGKQEPT